MTLLLVRGVILCTRFHVEHVCKNLTSIYVHPSKYFMYTQLRNRYRTDDQLTHTVWTR